MLFIIYYSCDHSIFFYCKIVILFFVYLDKETSTCNTVGCVEAAANVLKFIDSSVDPCNDFYDFACGKFISDTTLSDEKVMIDTFSLARDAMQSELLKLIDSPVGTNETR